MLSNKYLDKVFSTMDKMDKKEKRTQKVEVKGERYFSKFSKGKDGFCKHYMGCKIELVSCKRECQVS